MADVFDSLGYILAQNLMISLAIPLLVLVYCKRRSPVFHLLVMILAYLILWVLWIALINTPIQPQWGLFLACLGTYTFIRSLARLA